jgi:hypothetical protein
MSESGEFGDSIADVLVGAPSATGERDPEGSPTFPRFEEGILMW